MSEFDPAQLSRLRGRLTHPVIDADGHLIEFLPAVREELVRLAGESLASQLDAVFGAAKLARGLERDARRSLGLFRMSWWAFPAERTLDRATAMLPALLAERLPEIGIDFAILYPTLGLTAPHLDEPELRSAATRAFNRYYAASCAGHADRLTPAAVIPMHTPEEAIAELDFAVLELGLRAAVLAGYVPRPLPGHNEARAARFIDSFGPDDPHAYDAVWRRCVELGIAPSFHSSAMGWGTRASLTSYVFNHIGSFAAAGEGTCRSLFLAGVPHRFPELRFAFLEGGVAWAASLHADLIGHFEKRGAGAIRSLDPAALDRELLRQLFERYGGETFRRHLGGLDASLEVLSDPAEDPTSLDEFRHCGVKSAEALSALFSERFYFGCEADDPLNVLAFDRRTNPLGARLRALFSSDIGHWDVPDMRAVVLEAYELLVDGRLDEADFRRFTFANAVELFASVNPDFFTGTAVEAEARAQLARAPD